MNDLVSLSELFDKRIYRIPDYQRGYAWTTNQLEDFWDDLNNLTEDRFHYTGMLSLKLLGKDVWDNWDEERWIIRDKGYNAFHVVDGQQRLTTFVILVSSIIKCASSNDILYLNSDDIEDIKSRYIVEFKKPEKLLSAYKFGYESDNPSFEYLRYEILGESQSKTLLETFYTLNLENAKKYFDEKVAELYKNKGLDELESLFRKLVNRMHFNIHYIDDDFDVFVAFETMNNRGKKLSNLEILKNRLIYLTTIYPDNVISKDEKDSLRKKINEAWKEVYYQLGRNKNNPLNDDEYLRNHWSLFFKYSRNTGDDYIDFLLGDYFNAKAVYGLKRKIKTVIENDTIEDIEEENNKTYEINETDGILVPSEIKSYVESLMSVAQYWYYSFNPEENKEFTADEIKWILKLNRIGINYYRTLVVASFLNKEVSSEQRVELFKIIEKSLFVFFRMARWQASYQSTVAYNFARELMKGEKSIDDIISALNEKFDNVKKEAVDTFITKVQGLFKNHNGFYSWSDLRYFLFEYEMKLYDETHVQKLSDWNSFTKSEKDKISIEHIFPQSPTKFYWRNQFRDYTNEEYHYLANSLGNLLALSQSVNSALQNDEFEDKKNSNGKRKRGYSNGSHSEVEVSHYADWTPETIKDRGLKLLSFMENRWSIEFEEDSKLKILDLEFMMNPRNVTPELKIDDLSKFNDVEDKGILRDTITSSILDIIEQKEKEGILYALSSDKAHIRFSGKSMRKAVGLLGNGDWSKIKDLVAYEIYNTKDEGVGLIIYIGPSNNQEARKKWHNFSLNTNLLGGKYKTVKSKWDPMNEAFVFAKSRSEYDSDKNYANVTLSSLNSFFDNIFPLIEDAFENAPMDENDEVYKTNLKSIDEKDIDGFLIKKNPEIINIYQSIINGISNKIDNFSIIARPNYLVLKNNVDKNICEFHFLRNKLQITTKEPKADYLKIGNKLPDNYLWTLNYQIDALPECDTKLFIEAILDVLDN